ncbi:hypothetical protein QCM8_287 [Bacillus phage QCM8]|nr:hypothetical protein QCM8_11 [Bacillus phage QCM8]AOZ62205.1 hypothetical protein QCM8_287 [Bacillus phage QCM8]
MAIKFVQCENMVFEQDGQNYDFDRYVFEITTPMSHQDWSIVVDFQNTNIEGDAIRYGSWDTLVIEECLMCLATLEPHQIKREFSHMLTPANYSQLGTKAPQEAPQAAPMEEPQEETERQLYNEAGEPIDSVAEGELPYTESGDILVLDDMVLNNEQIGVEFMSTYENKADGWKAYEFQTNDFLHFAFYENGGSLFRLEIGTDEQGKEYAAVNVAYSEDYTCMEDVTGYFNTDELIRIMRDTKDITDVQDDYENWCEEEGEEY